MSKLTDNLELTRAYLKGYQHAKIKWGRVGFWIGIATAGWLAGLVVLVWLT